MIRCLILSLCLTLVPKIALAGGKNRIIELKGDAQVKWKGTTNYHPAFTGMTLIVDDILLPKEGTEVMVNCSDGKVKKAQAGVPSGLKAICPSAKDTDPRSGGNIFIDLLQGEFTYKTLLLAENPVLTWQAVSGVNRYQVTVKAGDEEIWSKMVEDTSVEYQGDSLRPKFFYDLEVEALKENEPLIYQLQLRLVNPVIAEIVAEEVAVIEGESVSEEARALMLVDYYLQERESVQSGFLWEGASTLEKLVQSGNQTPIIHRLLGDIYLRLGRSQEAKERYEKVILLAESVNNSWEIASAQVGLASVAVTEGNLSEAKTLLEKAGETYQLMEDDEQLKLIQDWIVELEKRN